MAKAGDRATDPWGGVWMLLRGRAAGDWWLSYQPGDGAPATFLVLSRREGPGIPPHRTREWARLARFADDLAALVAAVEADTPPNGGQP